MRKRILNLILMSLSALICFSCCTKNCESTGTKKDEFTRNAVIYEVNLRQYTEEGTINAFVEYLPYLKSQILPIILIRWGEGFLQ